MPNMASKNSQHVAEKMPAKLFLVSDTNTSALPRCTLLLQEEVLQTLLQPNADNAFASRSVLELVPLRRNKT